MISNLSIRTKLVLLLLAPLLTLLVFASIAVVDRFDTAGVANDATAELEVAESAMFVIRELGAERAAAVQLLINSSDGREATDLARARADEAIADLASRLETDTSNLDMGSDSGALGALRRIDTNRQQIDTFAVEQAEAYENYNGIIADLLDLEAEVLRDLGDAELLQQGQLTLAGIQGQERVSRQAAFLGTRLELIELTGPDYVAFSGIRNEELLFFEQLDGTDEISQFWQASRDGMEASVGDDLVAVVDAAGQGGSIPGVAADVWWDGMAAKAQSFDSAANESFDTILDNAKSKASSARTGAILFGLIGLLTILLAVLMALALGRSIARRLSRLSEEASTIATERLPEVLESLRNPTPEALSGAMPTIDSDATDEIGVMADSFDTVLRTSVETSIEHSQQRAKTITDLLVNLGRRNQTLIGRQLSLIDDLEAREEDPELLEALYSLDSLITRNRRNSENLLVLAGESAARSSTAPVSLYELVQAASGEVSELERIEITGNTSDSEMLLGKPAVNLSHLVAELLDNALSFSPKTTKVTAHIASKMGRHRIWVIDEGVGMTDEELEEANARLLDPTDIDELSTDRIGFQVISRIAQRLGVTVSLVRNPYGGLAASVDVPRELLLSDLTAPAVEVAPARRAPVQAGQAAPGAPTAPADQVTGAGLKRRTPGKSLASDLKAEAAGRVTHRRLGDGRSNGNRDADRRKDMNSRLARSIKRSNATKEQNQ